MHPYGDNPDFAIVAFLGLVVFFVLAWVMEYMLPKSKLLQEFFKRFS